MLRVIDLTDHEPVEQFVDPVVAKNDATVSEVQPLSFLDISLLEFEQDWARHGDNKDDAIRCNTGLTPFMYRERLAELAEHPETSERFPFLVRRLKKQSARPDQWGNSAVSPRS